MTEGKKEQRKNRIEAACIIRLSLSRQNRKTGATLFAVNKKRKRTSIGNAGLCYYSIKTRQNPSLGSNTMNLLIRKAAKSLHKDGQLPCPTLRISRYEIPSGAVLSGSVQLDSFPECMGECRITQYCRAHKALRLDSMLPHHRTKE